jgi:hypothetical protein
MEYRYYYTASPGTKRSPGNLVSQGFRDFLNPSGPSKTRSGSVSWYRGRLQKTMYNTLKKRASSYGALGYGAYDGTCIPQKGVKVMIKDGIRHLLIITAVKIVLTDYFITLAG